MLVKDKKFTLYKHTNKINGKVYIGITCQSPIKRWGLNGSGYKTQMFFRRAIEKYGWDNFTHEILYSGLDNEDAVILEAELIAYYKSLRLSYNMSDGYDDTPDTSIPIDVYNLKHKFLGSFKSIQEASDTLGVSPSGLNGSLHTYNGMFHYKGYVVVNKGTSPDWRKWEDRKRKTTKVKQFDKEGNLIACFDSINEAARLTKAHKGSLSNCLNGRQLTAGGYIWKR